MNPAAETDWWQIAAQLGTIIAAAVAVYVGIIRPALRRREAREAERMDQHIRHVVREVRDVKHQVEDNGHTSHPPTMRDEIGALRSDFRAHQMTPASIAHPQQKGGHDNG